MNVLEKILEEINEKIKFAERMMVEKPCDKLDEIANDTAESFISAYEACGETIRSHMDEIPNCEGCSRRKWYQKGIEHGKKDNDWIPYTRQNTPKKKGIYLVTCDDEEYPVKRMRFKKEDEYGLWYDDYGIYDGVILAWQPLPEPYIKNPK